MRQEDFMDEEDLEDAMNANELVAKDDFSALGSTARELQAKRAVASITNERY